MCIRTALCLSCVNAVVMRLSIAVKPKSVSGDRVSAPQLAFGGVLEGVQCHVIFWLLVVVSSFFIKTPNNKNIFRREYTLSILHTCDSATCSGNMESEFDSIPQIKEFKLASLNSSIKTVRKNGKNHISMRRRI